MKHELWIEDESEQTFCLAGLHGESARQLLSVTAKLVWTCDANSHFEAMSKYYQYMDWGNYASDFPDDDKKPYKSLGWE
tara:strand:- start:671 stop:907 length:237 start_codon:yes stop_codon:yes gene_type:complete